MATITPSAPPAPDAAPVSVHALSPAEHAVLALLVAHGQRYGSVAGRLGMDAELVRARAHAAVGRLIGWQPAGEGDLLLIDDALGQLPAHESAQLAMHLREHDVHRSISARIAAALDGFASRPLPGTSVAEVGATIAKRSAPRRGRRELRPGQRLTSPSRTVALGALGASSIAVGSLLLVLGGAHP
jgi:hypothetical protein